MTLGPDGTPVIRNYGSANARALITGDVVDEYSNGLGDLYKILMESISTWDSTLAELGIGESGG